MSSDRLVTMKYLADLAGVNPGPVRKHVKMLRSLASDSEFPMVSEG